MHIVVVDDEKDVQLLFQQHFRREVRDHHITFHFALLGEEGLDYLEHHGTADILLLLSDINMPGMDGIELLKQVKERFALVKVFMITAYNDEHHYRIAMQYGADDYITKPIDFSELRRKIQTL